MRSVCFIILLFILFCGCKTSGFPVKPLPSPGSVKISPKIVNDSLQIDLTNRLKAPVLIKIEAADSLVNKMLDANTPMVLQAEQHSVVKVNIQSPELPKLEFKAHLGDPQKEVTYSNIALPVPKNKKVRIIQGHNGSYSHDDDTSRYAIDFGLKINDTIFAAADGFAVVVVDGYKYGGKDIRYLDFANAIIVYNPDSGLFFQYSHLIYKGVFVKQGDWVKQGQPIGLVGMTGYTDVPHLHFNVFAPNPAGVGLVSVPVDFIEGYRGSDFQKNVIIERSL